MPELDHFRTALAQEQRHANPSQRARRISRLEMGFMVLCLWCYIIPSASLKLNFIYMLMMVCAYIVYAMHKLPYRYNKEVVKCVCAALFIAACYWFLTVTETIQAYVSNYELKRYMSKFAQVAFSFFPILLFARLHYAGTRKQKTGIAVLIALMFFYVTTQTWQQLLINPNVARDWSNENLSNAIQGDIGTYAFAYAMSMMVPTMMVAMEHSRKWIYKGLCMAAVTALFLFLLKAQYTLSVLIAALGVVIYEFKTSNNFILKLTLVLSLPLTFLVLPFALTWLAGIVESRQMSIRLEELAIALYGGDWGYNLGARLTLYGDSLKAFFESPIWGNSALGFDGHATFLTILSDVGLLGGIPYYYLYFSSKKRIDTLLGKSYATKRFYPAFFCLILMGCTNPIHRALPLYIVVWLLLPLLLELFVTRNPSSAINREERAISSH